MSAISVERPTGVLPVFRGHEPSGMTSDAADDRTITSLSPSGWLDGQRTGTFQVVTGTRPDGSSGSVGEMEYATGYPGGGEPGYAQRAWSGSGWRRLYVCFWLQLSANWDGHQSGVNKTVHIWSDEGKRGYISAQGAGNGTLDLQFRAEAEQAINYSCNITPKTWTRGAWHLVELEAVMESTAGAEDGTIRVWFDNDLAIEAFTVPWCPVGSTRNWQLIEWAPTYGGTGDTVPATQYQRISRLYTSRRAS